MMINISSTATGSASRGAGNHKTLAHSEGSTAATERRKVVGMKPIEVPNREYQQHCDANNNNGNVHSTAHKLEHLKSDDSASYETEKWQLLEVDEQLKTTEGLAIINKMDQPANRNTISHKSIGSGIDNADAYGKTGANYIEAKPKSGHRKSDKKYLDIDPMGPGERQNYSPTLVYLCTALYSMVPFASIIVILSLTYLIFTSYYFITLAYLVYVILDRNTCNRGGCRSNTVYNSRFWSYLAAYFPIKLRHSTEFKLNPSENYILNYHPHGISAFGAVTAFATNGLNFSKLFPGITARFMVHETSFLFPVIKETFALRGDCSVNSKSIDYMLSKKSTGNLLTIVVGGLAEADMSEAEVLKTVVVERKGFVKKALIHGANLIPCIAFGENSVFHKVNFSPNSLMKRLQTKWYELFKFKHPIYYGKGILFEKAKGLMPYKRPITVVMGDPIVVQRVVDPTQKDIDKLHAIYLDQLRSIYEANVDLRVKYDKKLELF